MKLRSKNQAIVLLLLVMFCGKGLNVAADAISEMTGERIGPVIGLSFEKDRELTVTCFARSRSLPVDRVAKIYTDIHHTLRCHP